MLVDLFIHSLGFICGQKHGGWLKMFADGVEVISCSVQQCQNEILIIHGVKKKQVCLLYGCITLSLTVNPCKSSTRFVLNSFKAHIL